jgi:hypothetical protein
VSENLRVIGCLLACMTVALLFAYLAAERPFSFSLIDPECRDAQKQYYDALNRARIENNKNPSAHHQDAGEERNHADLRSKAYGRFRER